MSKFIDAVKAKLVEGSQTRMTEPDPMPLLLVETEMSEPIAFYNLREYDVSVKYGATVYCRPEEVEEMRRSVVSQLREDVFGDLRKKAYALEHAFYAGTREDCREALHALMKEVVG